MAIVYLRSTDGSDADNGSTWALAKATLAAALTAAGAGGTVYVSQVHAETVASAMTLASPGTTVNVVKVLCVNDGAGPPTTLATTATVSTTGASSITCSGYTYTYGITFNCGDGANSASFQTTNAARFIFEACKIVLNNTSSTSRINIGGTTTSSYYVTIFKNTALQFGATNQYISANGTFKWLNTQNAILGATFPSSLFLTASGNIGDILIDGVDLSALGANIIFNINTVAKFVWRVVNCKLGSAALFFSGVLGVENGGLDLHNCDSGNTNYRMECYRYHGSIKVETVVVRTGGASNGTTTISWNMTTLATVGFSYPLESPVFSIWNDTTGSSKTVTVEILHDSVTDLNDDEVWLEVEELGTSGYPVSTIQSDRKANILATAAAQPTSSTTWTTTGLTNPNKQYLSVTFTPQMKGYFQCKVMLAKASKTIYVDPLITVS